MLLQVTGAEETQAEEEEEEPVLARTKRQQDPEAAGNLAT